MQTLYGRVQAPIVAARVVSRPPIACPLPAGASTSGHPPAALSSSYGGSNCFPRYFWQLWPLQRSLRLSAAAAARHSSGGQPDDGDDEAAAEAWWKEFTEGMGAAGPGTPPPDAGGERLRLGWVVGMLACWHAAPC